MYTAKLASGHLVLEEVAGSSISNILVDALEGQEKKQHKYFLAKSLSIFTSIFI